MLHRLGRPSRRVRFGRMDRTAVDKYVDRIRQEKEEIKKGFNMVEISSFTIKKRAEELIKAGIDPKRTELIRDYAKQIQDAWKVYNKTYLRMLKAINELEY